MNYILRYNDSPLKQKSGINGYFSGTAELVYPNGEVYSYKNKENAEKQLLSDLRKNKTPQSPFITDTTAWTKLGLKTALKEAVAQGAERIAWSTGEQQFDRWGSEKISWKKEGNKWKIDIREQQGSSEKTCGTPFSRIKG